VILHHAWDASLFIGSIDVQTLLNGSGAHNGGCASLLAERAYNPPFQREHFRWQQWLSSDLADLINSSEHEQQLPPDWGIRGDW